MNKVRRDEFLHALRDICKFFAKKTEIPKKLSDLEADVELGAVKTVNGVEPDENGDVKVSTLSEDEAMALVAETGLVDPVTNENGKFFTDENGAIFIL